MLKPQNGAWKGGSVDQGQSSRRLRAWMAFLGFVPCAVAALFWWDEAPGLSFWFAALALAGPVVYLAGQAYVAGKCAEARGRIEAARARRKGGGG